MKQQEENTQNINPDALKWYKYCVKHDKAKTPITRKLLREKRDEYKNKVLKNTPF